MNSFRTVDDMMIEAAEGIRPTERMSVTEAAERYRFINNPGSYSGEYKRSITPYLVEPQDALASTSLNGMIFVGPSQCGKTEMVLNWITHTVMTDPADMMVVQTAQNTARDFSMRRIDRLHRDSEDVGEMLLADSADNTFDKRYKNGMILTLSWPSINELSGRPVPKLFETDYDRMTQDVNGEGTPYGLGQARMKTFGRFGMCAAESSPGFPHTQTAWVRKTPHEAPPVEGILSLYNTGDRARWYWQCVECKHAFEAHRRYLHIPASNDPVEASQAAELRCPNCTAAYSEQEGVRPGKREMNQRVEDGGHARWVKDGMVWLPEGELHGSPRPTNTASFWLNGVAASMSKWSEIVLKLLQAERTYDETGAEKALKTAINTDFGEAYTPKAQALARMSEQLKSRAIPVPEKMVPYGVRFILAQVDVQKNKFVVQMHGIHADGDISVIDRFDVKWSRREQDDKPGQLHYVNPATHDEDWRLLVPEVLTKTYPLADYSGRHMSVKFTVCDSGGKKGVTGRAYQFYRWLRRGYASDEDASTPEEREKYPYVQGLDARFKLLKGDPNPNSPRAVLKYPDSQRKDRNAGARGEIPVLFFNVNELKNMLDNRLDRTEEGGRINFPDWLDANFYKELTVEVKNAKGLWENPHDYRNESWDLLTYCLGTMVYHEVGFETIRWDKPPGWASEWDSNDLVFDPNVSEDAPFEKRKKAKRDLSALGQALA